MRLKNIIIAAAMAFSFNAMADDAEDVPGGKPEGRKGPGKERREEMIKKFDKDGDGKVSKEERQAAGLAKAQELIKKFDKDGDNALNAEELMEMHKGRMKKMRERRRGEGEEGRGRRGEGRGRRGGRRGGQDEAAE